MAAHPRAAYFAGYGALHLAVAEQIYLRGDEFRALEEQRVVHIENAAGLLAVYCPGKRIVQLRAHNTALAQIARGSVLSLRVMPGSARLLDGNSAQSFQTIPTAALFWHYGQACLAALDQLPELASQSLHVKRFPALDPSILLLRQLHLIHVLSHHGPSFEQLLPLLHEEARAFVCPDLASLHLTGSLCIGKSESPPLAR